MYSSANRRPVEYHNFSIQLSIEEEDAFLVFLCRTTVGPLVVVIVVFCNEQKRSDQAKSRKICVFLGQNRRAAEAQGRSIGNGHVCPVTPLWVYGSIFTSSNVTRMGYSSAARNPRRTTEGDYLPRKPRYPLGISSARGQGVKRPSVG